MLDHIPAVVAKNGSEGAGSFTRKLFLSNEELSLRTRLMIKDSCISPGQTCPNTRPRDGGYAGVPITLLPSPSRAVVGGISARFTLFLKSRATKKDKLLAAIAAWGFQTYASKLGRAPGNALHEYA